MLESLTSLFTLTVLEVVLSIDNLVVIAVLTSVIGVYYYRRVVVTVCVREPDVAWTRSAQASWGPVLAIVLAVVGTLLFGIFPAMLHDVAIAGSAALK